MKYKASKYTPRKSETLTSLSDLFSKAKSIAIVDYTKMTPSQATDLRRSIKKAGGEMKVTKNTLFKVASQQKDLKLEGLNAFIFSLSDEIAPLKTVADYIKKNNILSFRGGLWGEKILTAGETEALAKTPSKEISIAKILYLLNWNTSKLVRTLDAISKKEVTN